MSRVALGLLEMEVTHSATSFGSERSLPPGHWIDLPPSASLNSTLQKYGERLAVYAADERRIKFRILSFELSAFRATKAKAYVVDEAAQLTRGEDGDGANILVFRREAIREDMTSSN